MHDTAVAPPHPVPSQPTPPAAPAHAARLDPRAGAARIFGLVRRLRRAEMARQHGRLHAIKAAAAAPARATRVALEGVRKYGRVTAEHGGVSRAQQFASLWWLNFRYHYRPTTVYRHRLFTPARMLPAPGFMQWHEAGVLYRTVTQRAAAGAAETLGDKRRFARWCAEQGLPTPPILAEFEGGRVTTSRVAEGDAPATDLFAKWATQYGGDDTQRWRHEAGRYVDDDGRAWTFGEVVATLAERSRTGVVLLQPRLVNDPALRPLSPNALSTIRVMTTQRPGEAPRLLAGLLRMGTGKATADNFAQGGIASAADPETGVIGPARRVDEDHRTYVFTEHPDTGARIVGFRIPRWHEAIRLALTAHERLGPIPCVGWDVAVLEDGPVLIEGNWNPCTKLLQVATQTPLLETEFAGAFGAWLDAPACAFDDDWLVQQNRWSPV